MVILLMYFVSIDAGAQVANYFTRMWTRCGHCKLFVTGCIWVELPVQRRLYPIFLSGVRLPTSTSIPQVDGLSTDPRVLGRHIICGVKLYYLHVIYIIEFHIRKRL